jgi:Lipocalin-like domain
MRTLLLVAVIAMTVGSRAHSGAQAGHDGLEGVWRFVGEVDTGPERDVVSIGPKDGYEGFLIYTADGHMSATIMPRGRQWKTTGASANELRQTIELGTAYAGAYEVRPGGHEVRHFPMAAMDPADAGVSLTRQYAIAGDRLTLSGPFRYDGKMMTFTVTFERVK